MADENPTQSMPTARVIAKSSFEDSEKALEELVELKEIDFGDVFTSRDTELDAEEGRGISIFFYHDEVPNYLNLYVDSDNELRISLSLVGDNVSRATSIVNHLLSQLEQIVVEMISVRNTFERPYQSLDLPIREDTDLHVIGVRIEHKGANYVIQGNEGDNTSVTMRREPNEEFEGSVSDNFVVNDVDRLSRFMEENV